ncbi:hypothetical protein D3C80_1161090 [compost metagenome]
MVYQLKPRKCEHCDKEFLIRCFCQVTPEELEANRIHSLNAIARYKESMAELKKKYPDYDFESVC